MLCQQEGVLPGSDFFFFTPSATARNLLFYFTSVGHFFCDFGYRVTRKDYGNYLFLLVKKGRLSVVTSGKKYSVKEGETALINCHRPHEYSAVGFTEFLWIHFDGHSTEMFYREITERMYSGPVFHPENDAAIGEMLKNIISGRRYERFGTEYEDSLAIYEILMALCGNVSACTEVKYGVKEQTVKELVRYIDEHLDQDLTVRDLAEFSGLSESHFTRKFRQIMNSSPKEYIIRRRMNEAKYLLKTTLSPVKEIAVRVGFHSESHFTNTFTAQNGISPKKFREFPI
ncbi:MAG: helix-turn-helix domain-containing protein [Ruminococcus sp.]|jgi:AraC family transcriptional regulator